MGWTDGLNIGWNQPVASSRNGWIIRLITCCLKVSPFPKLGPPSIWCHDLPWKSQFSELTCLVVPTLPVVNSARDLGLPSSRAHWFFEGLIDSPSCNGDHRVSYPRKSSQHSLNPYESRGLLVSICHHYRYPFFSHHYTLANQAGCMENPPRIYRFYL